MPICRKVPMSCQDELSVISYQFSVSVVGQTVGWWGALRFESFLNRLAADALSGNLQGGFGLAATGFVSRHNNNSAFP
jgi:hypothetical protein